ncbi:MAG TPA: tRNA preQ1(34) S-adenosylmethionine ribosyltransferase-isomerase QueA [Acidiferrobacteraceae bacterium]|nr:tRNA preQ1(34) S-adenosylmethionine ribosyltransferase-isomerase QueA [Acidiferrobacteraceae bacterium]
MHISEFDYSLPDDLIAQEPLAKRSASRLLCLEGQGGQYRDCQFRDLGSQLRSGDLLVFNDTQVIPARVYGRKDSGGRVEVLVERVLADHLVLAQVRANHGPKPDQVLYLDGGVKAQVMGQEDNFYVLRFSGVQDDTRTVEEILQDIGHMPLPPYIRRVDTPLDRDRYQTVYAKHPGAVAAPTAGLHFDELLLDQLRDQGIEMTMVTLHVGAGTFQPIRMEDIRDHCMHAEFVVLSQETVDRVQATYKRGGRVIAVGTTSVRVLESAAAGGELAPYQGDTDIFIYPGYRFRVVDGLITNFHLPRSTLLMLVCAFAGRQSVLRAYRHAVKERYRFFSYGDGMFVTPKA